MTTAEKEIAFRDGELAGDAYLSEIGRFPEVGRLPFWKRAVNAAREINAEATRNQKIELLAVGLGSALVGAAASRR